jgi:hypothetical protein
MKTIIFLCGFYNVAFALFHLGFWKLFGWEDQLKRMTFANKGILQILNIQIICYFLMTAMICFAFSEELLTTALGKSFLIGTSIFWMIRTVQQFVFLRANDYRIHVLTFIFLLGSSLFLLPVLLKP